MAEKEAEKEATTAASTPSKDEINEKLKDHLNAMPDDKDKELWFQQITERVFAQNTEKAELEKRLAETTRQLETRGEQDVQSFLRQLERIRGFSDMTQKDLPYDRDSPVQDQLPNVTAILANAADAMENADENLDTQIDQSRKRRRLEAQDSTPQNAPAVPKTNADVLRSIIY